MTFNAEVPNRHIASSALETCGIPRCADVPNRSADVYSPAGPAPCADVPTARGVKGGESALAHGPKPLAVPIPERGPGTRCVARRTSNSGPDAKVNGWCTRCVSRDPADLLPTSGRFNRPVCRNTNESVRAAQWPNR
jgi:hypothetical protein